MNNDNLDKIETKQELPQKTPDEAPGLLIEAKCHIFDPETNETYLEGRG